MLITFFFDKFTSFIQLRYSFLRRTVFLFTDGAPTDETKMAIGEWKQNWQRTANLIAISFGEDADLKLLSDLTDNVLHFKNTNEKDYLKFFKWVTDSIKTSSVSVENNSSGFELAKLDGETLSKIDLTKSYTPTFYTDNNFVVLAAKCQNTKRPYLMKYKKTVGMSSFEGIELPTRHYRLVGAYQVDNSYFDLSYENSSNNLISTDELQGSPTCPCCGNQFAFAACQCGKIHCIGSDPVCTCPWCGNTGTYGFGDGGFDITRTLG